MPKFAFAFESETPEADGEKLAATGFGNVSVSDRWVRGTVEATTEGDAKAAVIAVTDVTKRPIFETSV